MTVHQTPPGAACRAPPEAAFQIRADTSDEDPVDVQGNRCARVIRGGRNLAGAVGARHALRDSDLIGLRLAGGGSKRGRAGIAR